MSMPYSLPRMTAEPCTESQIHHHGEQDTIVYAASGRGRLVFAGGTESIDLQPGDFALIPGEHRVGELQLIISFLRASRDKSIRFCCDMDYHSFRLSANRRES